MKRRIRTRKVRSGRLAGAFALALMVGGQSVAYAEHGQTGTVGLETAAASEGAEEKPIPIGVGGTMLDLRGHLLHVMTVTTNEHGKASARCSSDSAEQVPEQNTGVPSR